MCKLDLKDSDFSVPLYQDSQRLIQLEWEEKLYKQLYLCFSLGPTPKICNNLMKILTAFLRTLTLLIVIYLDDILTIGRTMKKVLIAEDTAIFLLQHLVFLQNLKNLFQINSRNKIIGSNYKFSEYNAAPHKIQIELSLETMPEFIFEERNDFNRINKIDTA